MSQILCSSGSLIGRPNGRNYRLLPDFYDRLRCDGIEFMMYDSWYGEAKTLADFLRGTGILFPVMHCEKKIGAGISIGGAQNEREALRRFAVNCEVAEAIGAGKMVLHLWDGEPSDQSFANNLRMYGELAKRAQDSGIDLLVENVVCNREEPMKHWRELAERYPDVHFVFDTKMAAFHGQEEWLYREEYEWLWRDGHIRHYHVNDYDGGYMDWARLVQGVLPIGAGHIDFGKFFAFIKKIAYDGSFTVEATAFDREGVVDTEMLNACFDRIRGWCL